jgi:TonB-linked SusC/RagA family outer membrane protein
MTVFCCLFLVTGLFATDTDTPLPEGNGVEGVLQAGKKQISGTVVDETGEPVIGANIVEKGTINGTITDASGSFSLNVPASAVLKVSFIGYAEQEVNVGSNSRLQITLVEDSRLIDEVVVIGYGSQKRTSITGAVSSMKAEAVENIPVSNLSNALAGRISGVYVNQASGMPGYSAGIRVRAVNTWKSSGGAPLYVIDGTVTDKSAFDGLDYSEVESITVLKDAASGAVYGARAANGVILVTTKTGKSGKFRLDYNYTYSFDEPAKLPEYATSGDAIRFSNMLRAASGAEPFADDEEVAYYTANDPGKAFFDEVYQNAVLQKHSLSGSGGTDKVRYFLGASYFDQTGFIETLGYRKYNVRSNVDVNFTDDLSGSFKFSFNEGEIQRFAFQEDNSGTFDSQDTGGTLIGRLRYWQCFARPTTTDGHFINTGWIGNSTAFIKEGGTNRTAINNTDFQIGLKYKIPKIDGLSVSGDFNRHIQQSTNKHYEVKPILYDVVKKGSHGLIYTDEIIGSRQSSYPSTQYLGQRQINKKSYQLNFALNYEKTFGEHNVSAFAGYEQSEGFDNTFYGVREQFPLYLNDQFWATSSARSDSYVGGDEYESGRASWIGRLSYQYADKYFLNATVRRDGSMLFAPDYRWGTFPSVSLGWVLSNEGFMQKPFLDFLKLRASWGLAGNDVVGGWAWAEKYQPNGSFMIGTSMLPRVAYGGIVNEQLTWEKTSEYNVGFDSRFLGGVILNMEYYYRHNYDILDSRIASLAASFGGSMPPMNYGKVDAHGIELELGYSGQSKDFSYEIKGNFTYAVNRVIERDVAENVRDVNDPNGRSTDYVAILVSKGILRTQADLDALPADYTIYGKKPILGQLNFEDVSGLTPGVPDGKIDDYDRQVIQGKHYNAPYVYGLNLTGEWKGFGIDVFFQGALGVSKMYNDGDFARRVTTGIRPPVFRLDSWTPDNINAKYPQAVDWEYTADHKESTFWLENGNYVKLQYLSLYYSLPKELLQKAKIANVKFMMAGNNLLTFSPFKYYDPAVSEIRGYPTMRTITLGANITF